MIVTTLTGGLGWLDATASAALNHVDHAAGRLIQITEAGRTHAQQAAKRRAYEHGEGSFALPAGQSIHVLGRAIDTDEWMQLGMLALLETHGWIRTALGRGEPWHFEYFSDRDRHRNSSLPTPQTLILEEDEDMPKLVQMPKIASRSLTNRSFTSATSTI